MSGGSLGSRGERSGQDPLQTLGANFPAGQHHLASAQSCVTLTALYDWHTHMKHKCRLSGHNVVTAFAIKERFKALTDVTVSAQLPRNEKSPKHSLLDISFCHVTKGTLPHAVNSNTNRRLSELYTLNALQLQIQARSLKTDILLVAVNRVKYAIFLLSINNNDSQLYCW